MIRRLMLVLMPVLVLAGMPGGSVAELLLSPSEIEQALRHGPWPPDATPDPSNHVSGRPEAIALGAALFGDPALSADGHMACTTCHDPGRALADGRARAQGRVPLDRNTPSLINVAANRWFGWAGASDNLWAASLLPILNPNEFGQTPEGLRQVMASGRHAPVYTRLFGPITDQTGQEVLVNTAKALAAWQETLTSGPTSFDRFRNALARGDRAVAGLYPAPAQRGLRLFLGRGRCVLCHAGPRFSNGEFHDAGVPYFVTPTRVDEGRFGGLASLRSSPYTLDGPFSDDPARAGGWAVRQVRTRHADFGIFRVPGLRGAGRTAPYMHDGSIADLRGVVEHYNTIDTERLHGDGAAILSPLGLTDPEISDLVAFLRTLSDDG